METFKTFRVSIRLFVVIMPMKIDKDILNQVERMFLKYGFKNVTMDDISSNLGISKKTLYNYVDTKSDLVKILLEEFCAKEKNEIDKIQSKAIDAIQEMMMIINHVILSIRKTPTRAIYDLKKYYRESWNLLDKFHHSFIYNTIRRNLESGIEQGLYRKDIDPDIISKFYVANAFILTEEEIFSPSEYNKETVYRQFINYHLNGIINNKGKELLIKYSIKN